MCIVDVQGRLVDANPEIRKLMAYGPDGPLGTVDFAGLLPAGLADVFRRALSHLVLSGETSMDMEAGIVDGNGQILDVILSLAPMPGSREVVISIVDVTQEKTYARNLAEANERLADFLSVAAHELSMPATVMKGYVQTLLAHQSSLSEEQLSELLQGIAKYSDRLSRLVSELLDASRVSAQRFEIDPAPSTCRSYWGSSRRRRRQNGTRPNSHISLRAGINRSCSTASG